MLRQCCFGLCSCLPLTPLPLPQPSGTATTWWKFSWRYACSAIRVLLTYASDPNTAGYSSLSHTDRVQMTHRCMYNKSEFYLEGLGFLPSLYSITAQHDLSHVLVQQPCQLHRQAAADAGGWCQLISSSTSCSQGLHGNELHTHKGVRRQQHGAF